MFSQRAVTEPGVIEGFAGQLIRPGDRSYDEARQIWNGMIDRRPVLIARCSDTSDVVAVVNHAREQGLLLAVRSGGHSIPGFSVCDGGVVLDLRSMNQIEVDPDARVVRAGGGVLAGELDRATQAYGLHTPTGRVTTTGIGGFTTGGGYGWTSTRHGLACDNLVSAEVVTAAGDVLTVSAEENPDLFWAIRGGGGNFGVVTRFDFRLHELGPTVLGGLALFPMARAAEVLRGWRDHVDSAPDELATACVGLTAPPLDFVPAQLRGEPAIGIGALYAGDPSDGESVIDPLRKLKPDLDGIGPMPYLDFQAILDLSAPPGQRNYARGEFLSELTDEAIDTFVEHVREPISPYSQMIIFQAGGAISRAAEDVTAAGHRDAKFIFHPIAVWEDPADDERQIAHDRAFCAAMKPFTTGGVYVNFTAEDEADHAYHGARQERLELLKHRYDPGNLFRLNQNIRPRPAG